jgi:hypothetical protein
MAESTTPVRRPLLSAVDDAEHLREVAFAMVLIEGRAVSASELDAVAAGSGSGPALDALARSGWLDRSEDGRIVGAGGLSLTEGPHRLRFGPREFRTWCAYDAMGIPAALAVDAEVETTCGVCGRALLLSMRGGQPDRDGPELLWLAAGGDDLRSGFCAPTVLVCGTAHGREWAAGHANEGELVTLGEATRRGALDWAGCAAAAGNLGRVEYVNGPLNGRTESRLELPDDISAPGGRYVHSDRCADDGAVRYVWHGDAPGH